MTKWALISNGRINQVEEEKFEVGGDLVWVECPDEVTIDFEYVNGEFKPIPKVRTHYTVARKVGYGDIGSQLGDIYDAMATGIDANEALATWAENQRKIKILLPKDNDDAMDAAHDEILKRQDAYYNSRAEAGLPFDKGQSFFTLQLADDYINGVWDNPVTGPYVA